MESLSLAVLAGAGGVLISTIAFLAVWSSERSRLRPGAADQQQELPAGTRDVLAVLRSIGIVVDSTDRVVNTSPSAVVHGLVRGGRVVHEELCQLAAQVRRDGVIREARLELARGPLGQSRSVMQARVAPLGASHVLLLVEDHTKSARVEEVRRDFVANVSHELKTPVGGLTLLAEATLEAKEDPAAVERFATRMQVETARLARLVNEIIELSRIQVADTLHQPHPVDVSAAIQEAIDHSRVAADAQQVRLEGSCEPDLTIYGDADLLVTAIRNLIVNSIAHSEPHSRVHITSRLADDLVEVIVSDQGHGIPSEEQERIFERFYRGDAARSRTTGGTGLGLSIVKHVAANHGGEVTVLSEPGQGATFTVRLPLAHPDAPAAPIDPSDAPVPDPRTRPARGPGHTAYPHPVRRQAS